MRPVRRQNRFITLSIAALILALGAGYSSPLVAQQHDNQDGAVRAVVSRYLHGLKFNDVSSLRSAFWPDAKLFFVKKDGSVGQ
jgi:hypothetical protein